MKNQRVLIIARDFPPYAASLGSVIRVIKLADFLRKHDYEVYVLAAKGREISYFGYEDVLKQLNVTYVDDPLQAYLNRRSSNSAKATHANKEQLINFSYCMRKIERLINDWIPPDIGVFFVLRYYKKAISILRRYNIRNIIVSSPPHSSQLIGLLLKHKLRDQIKLIIDYRDSWNTSYLFAKKNMISSAISHNLEKNILTLADHFIFVSSPMLKKINTLFPGIVKHPVLVMNGFDLDTVHQHSDEPFPNESLTIGYFGSLTDSPNSFRDPTLLFQSILELQAPIKLVIYGDARIRPNLRRQVKHYVEIRGNVSHQEALQRMQQMDLLLILHTAKRDGDEVITGKLFEYMSAQRPILVIGPSDMEAGRIVTEYGLGYHVPIEEPTCMLKELEQIYVAWQKGQLPRYNRQDLLHFSRQNQYAKLLPLME